MTKDFLGRSPSTPGSHPFGTEPQEASPPSVSIPIADVTLHLFRCGLAFRRGLPPLDERTVFFVWTGGCNAVQAVWRGEQLIPWNGEWFAQARPAPIDLYTVECWMRCPHPAIWPEAFFVGDLIPENALYAPNRDVFVQLAQGIEARRAETRSGSVVDESPVGEADAPKEDHR